jgi:hypothetical protein
MREVQTQEIDQTKYLITQLGAKQGKTVLARLLRIIGPAIEANDNEQIGKLMSGLTDAEIDFMCDTFARVTRVATTNAKGQDVEMVLSDIFDDHFAGKYDSMLKWLWACLNVNYATFIKGLNIDAAKAKALAMQAAGMGPTVPSGASSPAGGGA